MRFVSMLAWVVIIVAVVSAVFRRLGAPRPRRAALSDELVKDPVCHTYVARGRAVRLMAAGEPVYFCSDRCARRYTPAGG